LIGTLMMNMPVLYLACRLAPRSDWLFVRFCVMDDFVVLGEVAVDRRLQLNDHAEDPLEPPAGGRREEVSTALSHEPEVRVK
jgi:hypothetical protein